MLKLNPDFQPPTEVFNILFGCDETNSIAKPTLKFQYNQAAKNHKPSSTSERFLFLHLQPIQTLPPATFTKCQPKLHLFFISQR